MADEKNKVGIWVAITAGILFLIGILVAVLTGNGEIVRKAMEMLGRTKEHDKQADDKIKEAEEQKKKNKEAEEKAAKAAEEAKKDTEAFKEKVEKEKKPKKPSVVDEAKEQARKNKELLGG